MISQKYFMTFVFIGMMVIVCVPLKSQARSPRMLSTKVLPVHMSAKNCDPWEELVTQKDGAQRCRTKAHAEIDPSCTPDLFDMVHAKQECILNVEGTNSCLRLLTLAGLSPVVAGVAGKYVGKAFATVMKNKPVPIQNKFLDAIEVIKFERTQHAKAKSMWGRVRNESVLEVTNGKYQNVESLDQAINAANKEGNTEVFYRLNDLKVKSINLLHEKFKNVIEATKEPELSRSLSHMKSQGTGVVPDRMNEKWRKIFEYEHQQIKGILDARTQAHSNSLKAIERRDKEALDRYSRETDALNKRLQELGKKSARLQLYLDFLKDGVHLAGRPPFEFRTVLKYGKDISAEEKASRTDRYARRGALIGGVLDVGAIAAALAVGSTEIKSCQSTYGFRQDELDFLESGTFNVNKAKMYSGWKCDSLGFEDPRNAYMEIETRFGGVPAGICKMVKQQNNALDAFLGPGHINPSGSCEKISDTNLQIEKDRGMLPFSRGKDIIQVGVGAYVYKIPIDDVFNYPQVKHVEAFTLSGQPDKNQSLKIQNFYLNAHPPNDVFDVRPDLKDLAADCQPNMQNGETFCKMREAFVRMRVLRSVCAHVSAISDSNDVIDQLPRLRFNPSKTR